MVFRNRYAFSYYRMHKVINLLNAECNQFIFDALKYLIVNRKFEIQFQILNEFRVVNYCRKYDKSRQFFKKSEHEIVCTRRIGNSRQFFYHSHDRPDSSGGQSPARDGVIGRNSTTNARDLVFTTI